MWEVKRTWWGWFKILYQYKFNIWKIRDDMMKEWAREQVKLDKLIKDYEADYGKLI